MATAGARQEMATERIAPGALPRVLNSFDMTVIFVAIVLFIVQASVMQSAGPAGFIYWILGFVTFLIPGALVTAQLGLMFPEEGSLYVWTQKALGPFWGFFAGFAAWWPGVLVMVATSDLVVTLMQSINPAVLSKPWQQGLVILAVLWFSALLSILRFRVTQNYANVAVVFYGAAILVIGLAGVVWLAGGNPSANSFTAPGAWSLSTANWTFYGLAILALLGIEVPLNMGVEIVDMRAIKRYLIWGSSVVMLAYLWATFGAMVTVPAAQADPTTAVVQAVRIGFGSADWLGTVVAIILMWFFISNTVVYNYSFSRLLFVSGLERRMPQAVSHINSKTRVPDVAVVVQTVLASIFTIVTFMHSGQSSIASQVYLVLQASVTVIWCLSMVLLFADVFLVKRSFPKKFDEVRVSRTGALFAAGAIGMVASAMGVIVTLWSPWDPSLFTRGSWITWVGIVSLVSALVAVVIYSMSEIMRRREATPSPEAA
jgi:amino acid transporter